MDKQSAPQRMEEPQPLQPEERGSCCPRKDCPTCRGTCDELTDAGKLAIYPKLLEQLDAKDETIRDLIATIEEARRAAPQVSPGNATALSDSRMAELRHDIEECERGGILEWTVNARLKWSELKSLLGTIDRRADTYRKPGEGFVCFHCGERFTDYESAKEHFGEKPDADARCIEEARRGKPFSMLREKMTPEAREKSGAIAADILDWKSKFEAEHARASELQATLDSIRREQPVSGPKIAPGSIKKILNNVERMVMIDHDCEVGAPRTSAAIADDLELVCRKRIEYVRDPGEKESALPLPCGECLACEAAVALREEH